MSKNGIVLSIIAVLLGAVYVFYFTDLFQKQSIQIIPQIRPGRPSAIPRDPGTAAVCPVSFALDGKYKLTALKVLPAEDFKTNKYATPLWHLISDSNSIPTKSIVYGLPIKGMKPAVPRARPETLQPDMTYLVIIEAAGPIKGQTNFHTREFVTAPAAP